MLLIPRRDMSKRYTFKTSEGKRGFETDLFKGFNSTEDNEDPDRSDNDEADPEEEYDKSDEELLINSDDDDDDKDEKSSRVITRTLSDSDDDVEDDAPEAVSFSSSKQTALEQMKSAIKQIDQAKQQAKQKRKKLDEKYKEQKRKKLKELSDSKLPDEFLADLSDEGPKSKKPKTEKQKTEKSRTTTLDSGEDEDIGSLADTEDDVKETDTDDYIPLESDRLGGVEVLALKEEKKKAIPVSEKVLNFKEQMLYGKKIHRESTNSKLARNEKRKARFR